MKGVTSRANRQAGSRRVFVTRLLRFATLAAAFFVPRPNLHAKTTGRATSTNGKLYMHTANEMRQRAIAAGDQAFGAVIVKGTQIVGRGPSAVVTKGDPTAHAEMEAIRDACQRLGTNDLSGCTMYGTSPPCPMCETAAYWARLDEVRFGADGDSGHAPRYGGC